MNPIIQTILDRQDPPDDPYNPSNASVAADDGTGNVPAGAYRYASLNPTRPDTSGLERATRELGAAARRRAKAQREAAEEEENARRAQMGAGLGAEIARLISGQNIQTNTRRNMEAAAKAASNRRRAEANEAGIDAESRARAAQRIAEINQAADASLREQEAAETQRRVAAYNRRQKAIDTERAREEGVSERREDRASQREFTLGRDATAHQRQRDLIDLRNTLDQQARDAEYQRRRELAEYEAGLEGGGGLFGGREGGNGGGESGQSFVPGAPAYASMQEIQKALQKEEADASVGYFFDAFGQGDTPQFTSEDQAVAQQHAESLRGALEGMQRQANTKGYEGYYTDDDLTAISQAQGILSESGDTMEGMQKATEMLAQAPAFQHIQRRREGVKVAQSAGLQGDDARQFAGRYAQYRARRGPDAARVLTAEDAGMDANVFSSAGSTQTPQPQRAPQSNQNSGRSRPSFEDANRQWQARGNDPLTRSQYDATPTQDFYDAGISPSGSNKDSAQQPSDPAQKQQAEANTSSGEESGEFGGSGDGGEGQAYTEDALQSARDEYGAVDLEADVIELGDDPTEAELDAAREEARRSDAPVLTFYQDGQRRISSGKDARDYLNRENTFLAGRALRSAGRGIANAVRGAGQAVANSMSLQPDQARKLLSQEGYVPNQRAEVVTAGGEDFVLIKEDGETVERVPSERLNLGRLSGAQDYADRFNRLAEKASEGS